jgi:two-component system, OmpR family, phosphate regulon sensor histidine kinase PhoR
VVERTKVGIVPLPAQDKQGASEFNAVLLAMAAHDLRQPLQLIHGAFSWLDRHNRGGREQEYIERGELATRRPTEQLDHLVDALRLHEQRTSILPVELGPLLDALRGENSELRAA